MSKHTHQGHCQLCDRLQAVRNGSQMLAKHGYTKRWGFFNGTCPGSDAPAYELSAARIQPAIDRISVVIRSLDDSIAAIQAMALSAPRAGKITISRHLPKEERKWGSDPKENRAVSGFFAVEATSETGFIRTRFILDAAATFRNGDVVSEINASELYRTNQFYGCGDPAAHAAKWRNDEIADLRGIRARHVEYRAWLQSRMENWKLAELVAVK